MKPSILKRLQALESVTGKKQPGVMILYRSSADGSLVDQQTGEPVPDDADFFGLRVILHTEPGTYREPTGGEFPGAKSVLCAPKQFETPEAWEQAHRAK